MVERMCAWADWEAEMEDLMKGRMAWRGGILGRGWGGVVGMFQVVRVGGGEMAMMLMRMLKLMLKLMLNVCLL